MADTFNNDLRVREQEAGSNSGTWGGLLNTTISNLASAFGQGSEAIPNASTHTITLADGTADDARSMYLKCTNGGQACTVTLAPNTISKVWIISNETSYTLTFSQGSGANVAVAAGAVKMIVTDGAGATGAVTDALSGLEGAFSTVTADGLTVDGVSKLKAGSTSTPADTAAFISNASAKIVVNHGNEYGAYVGYANSSNDAIGIQSTTSGGTTAPLSLNPYGGNVGIGTTAASHKLEIESSSDADLLQVQSTAASNDTALRLGISGNVATINATGGSTGILALKTYGTERVRVDASGRVGIGESSPATDLHITNSGATQLLLESGTSSQGILLFGDADDLNVGSVMYDHSDNSMRFETSDTERMRIDSNGHIGINVSSSLDQKINMSDTADVGIKMTKTGSITTTVRAVGGALAFGVDGSAGTTERMRINSSGYAGIGTTNPLMNLHLSSSGDTGIQITKDGSVASRIKTVSGALAIGVDGANGDTERFRIDSSGNATVKAAGELRIRDDGTFIKEDQGLQIGNTSGTGSTRPIRFFTESAERMRVDSSGKVGIGTGGDNPTALLEVEAASNPEISIASSGGATSNFLNFKAISHSQQVQTQLKTIDNGDFTSDLAFLFKASGTSGALGEKARLTADGNLLVGTSSDTNTGKVRIQGATSSAGDSTVLTLHQGNFANGGASLIKIGTEAGNFAKAAIGFKRTDDYDRGAIIFCQENTGDQSDVDSSDEVARIDQGGGINKVAGSGATLPAIAAGLLAGEFKGSADSAVTNDSGFLRLSAGGGTTVGVKAGIDIFRGSTDGSLIRMFTSGSEALRVDASGNLLVGKTSTAFGTEGLVYEAGAALEVTTDSNRVLRLNRTTNDGNIIELNKDGSLVGSIGTSGGDLTIGTGDTGIRFDDGTDQIYPVNGTSTRDGAIDLGWSGGRFQDIYATNGTIQTSDRNEKQDIEALSDAEQRVAVAAKGLLRKFRWKSSVAENGDDARIHFGIIAQDLQAAFEAEGLDAGRYAMFINSTWTDEDTGEERTRMGVRYSELLAFIIAAI